jgi:hypothetical protein
MCGVGANVMIAGAGISLESHSWPRPSALLALKVGANISRRPISRRPAFGVRADRDRKPGRPVALQSPHASEEVAFAHLRARRALASPDRNFNLAARASGWECHLDGAAQFMRDEIADKA